MKKLFFLFCLAAASVAGFSQTNKGDFLVGGNLGFRTNSTSSNFTLTPNIGYFFAKHVAAGANLTVNFEKEGSIKTTDLGLGPFARLYIGESSFRPFLHASVGYLNSTYKYGSLKSTNNGFYTTLGLGYAAFIGQNVAFEGLAAYNYTDVSHAGSSNGFSLNFGFQVYINHDRMNTLRKGQLE